MFGYEVRHERRSPPFVLHLTVSLRRCCGAGFAGHGPRDTFVGCGLLNGVGRKVGVLEQEAEGALFSWKRKVPSCQTKVEELEVCKSVAKEDPSGRFPANPVNFGGFLWFYSGCGSEDLFMG